LFSTLDREHFYTTINEALTAIGAKDAASRVGDEPT
jgi:hypothetical protein